LITDNGIGIAEEHQKKIFDIFTRLHTKETFPGSGVGLSISKKLMERMGGTITVKSALGEGAIFSLIFSSDVIKNSN
jgi:signal transduction histidine kinase